MYISGGENVFPAEVERVLQISPDVTEVAVIGCKDAKWGETGHAFVCIKTGISSKVEETLKELCQNHLARFKHPTYYSFVEEIPKLATGKIDKVQLREIPESEQTK